MGLMIIDFVFASYKIIHIQFGFLGNLIRGFTRGGGGGGGLANIFRPQVSTSQSSVSSLSSAASSTAGCGQ